MTAVTFDYGTGAYTTPGNGTTSKTLSWDHTATNASVVFACFTVISQFGFSGNYSVTACTYGGTNMTLVGSVGINNQTTAGVTYMYSLSNPASGVKSVSVSLSTSTGYFTEICGGSASFYNSSSTSSPFYTTGNTKAPSLTATVPSDGMLFGVLAGGSSSVGSSGGLTVTAGTAAFNITGSWCEIGGLYRTSSPVSGSTTNNQYFGNVGVTLSPNAANSLFFNLT